MEGGAGARMELFRGVFAHRGLRASTSVVLYMGEHKRDI